MITKKQVDRITLAASKAGLRVIHMRKHSKVLYNSFGEQVRTTDAPSGPYIILMHPSAESLYGWLLSEKEERETLGY